MNPVAPWRSSRQYFESIKPYSTDSSATHEIVAFSIFSESSSIVLPGMTSHQLVFNFFANNAEFPSLGSLNIRRLTLCTAR